MPALAVLEFVLALREELDQARARLGTARRLLEPLMDDLDVATADLVKAVDAMLMAIGEDEASGLLTRKSLRSTDEVRVVADRVRRLLVDKARGRRNP